ncbi:hypothetical protein SCBWM1_gp37 [Synechococcus phage S-CBWM1]|uniref:Uncharacterized protein n=1 Tax=Synechococcus phage S-CBWM1 TaxID=2053653 RepID=A0A3G1L3G4_9CAUD|nr:hypothetical protein HOU61_gp160 [Synechococcus phage S-CBWM1]ATW62721.1 hypothetical protein SCBWM1_gp37 [Synechococcus phage S-CBWM1]
MQILLFIVLLLLAIPLVPILVVFVYGLIVSVFFFLLSNPLGWLLTILVILALLFLR